MQVVVIRSPKALCGILRKLASAKRTESKKGRCVAKLLHTGLLLPAYRRLLPHTLLRKRTGKGAHCTWN